MTHIDIDQGEEVSDPLAAFTAIAVKHGMIRPGDKLDGNVIEAFGELVGLCATVGDAYGDGEDGGNAGDHIRALYWPF